MFRFCKWYTVRCLLLFFNDDFFVTDSFFMLYSLYVSIHVANQELIILIL
jgi:hypothetical protein